MAHNPAKLGSTPSTATNFHDVPVSPPTYVPPTAIAVGVITRVWRNRTGIARGAAIAAAPRSAISASEWTAISAREWPAISAGPWSAVLLVAWTSGAELMMAHKLNIAAGRLLRHDKQRLLAVRKLLRHEHHGVDLRQDQAKDTLANLQFLWSRPVSECGAAFPRRDTVAVPPAATCSRTTRSAANFVRA